MLSVDNRSALTVTLTLLQMHTSLCTESATNNLYEQTRAGDMDDQELPWSSSKRNSDKFAKNGEEMMDILVDDIDRF